MGYLGQLNPKWIVAQAQQAKATAMQTAAAQLQAKAAQASTPEEKSRLLAQAAAYLQQAQTAQSTAQALQPKTQTQAYAPGAASGFQFSLKNPIVLGGITVAGLAAIWFLFLRKKK